MSTDFLKNISFFTLQNKDGNVSQVSLKIKTPAFYATNMDWIISRCPFKQYDPHLCLEQPFGSLVCRLCRLDLLMWKSAKKHLLLACYATFASHVNLGITRGLLKS